MSLFKLKGWMGEKYKDEDAPFFGSLNVIPATHNSAAVHPKNAKHCIPWGWAKCQSASIVDQLNMGIRCFDLRLRIKRPVIKKAELDAGKQVTDEDTTYSVTHFFESTYTLHHVIDVIDIFLHLNPTETVFVMIKPEWKSRGKWTFGDLDVMWKKIGQTSNVLTNDVCSKKLSDLTFGDVRGKMIVMPNGHFYHSYNDRVTGDDDRKVNCGRDVSVIHTLRIVYPRFLNVCENWDAKTVSNAKNNIENFLDSNLSTDRVTYPFMETNVLLWKGAVPPAISYLFMHYYLKNQFDIEKQRESNEGAGDDNVNSKRMGFVLLDFANEDIVRKLLSNNLAVGAEENVAIEVEEKEGLEEKDEEKGGEMVDVDLS